MTPATYLALARDIGIVIALAFVIWRIYGAGENAVKASDLKALQTQVAEQAQTLQGWRQESMNANTQLRQDLATLRAPADPKPPVWLCNDPSADRKVLPSTTTAPRPQLPDAGRAVEGPRRDIRPDLERFRLKYETALAECRAEHAQWPQ